MIQSLLSFDYVTHHDSPVGAIFAGWRAGKLCRIALPGSGAAQDLSTQYADAGPPDSRSISPKIPKSLPSEYRGLSNYLQESFDLFFDSKPHGFDWRLIDVGTVTDFQKRVLFRCFQLLPGETCGYGDLASLVGSPGAARAVGQVMANNRHPLLIPCHRVVAAGAKIGGFSAPGGLDTKRWLLQREGVIA